jgi:putative iron-dependent peroxidase
MPEPQPVLTPLTQSAIFLVVSVRQGGEAQIRELLADVPSIGRSVGFREPDGELKAVVGIGSDLWDRIVDGPRPPALHPFRELHGPKHHAPSTPGDLLFHIRARRMDLCFEFAAQVVKRLDGAADVVDEVHGFKYFDERDLLGFVDGTENPTGSYAANAAIISDGEFAGGSFVIIQKYLHDLEAWNALTVEEQERAIGRTKLDDMELPDDAKAPDAHITLNVIEDDAGNELKIVRDNMPFGRLGDNEFGTYFIGYASDRRSPNACCTTCSSAIRPARPTASSTSRRRTPAACSSSHRRSGSTSCSAFLAGVVPPRRRN